MSRCPTEIIEFLTGDFCARVYGDIELAEQSAQKHANLRGVEVDLVSCSVDEHGEVVSRERMGLRILPAGSPYVSAFGPVEA